MEDPSDKNNQPRREGSDEHKEPKKTPKSVEAKRRKLFERRRLQHQQEQRQRRASRPRRQPPSPPSPPAPPLPLPPPPTLRLLAGRALQMAREFLQEAGRAALALPPGKRILFIADKALCCAMQALRWAVPPHRTKPHAEDVELPQSPFGLNLGERVKSTLMKIDDALSMARTFLDLQRPGNKAMADQMRVYRREIDGLRPARPHTARPVQESTAPRTQSTGQSFALWPTSTQAAGPAPTEAAGPSSAAGQRISVTPAPSESSSSSSSSSSASTGSITEEVVVRYYSPPRFTQGWTKREGTGDENREKPEQDDERKDSEAQESDEQSASVAEEAATVFAQAPIPPPAGQGVGEPGAEAGAAGAQGRRRPSRVPKPFFFGLLGLKMA